MKRILLIGNSHSAAMRYAWENICPDYPDVEVDILAQGARAWAAASLSPSAELATPETKFFVMTHDGASSRTHAISIANYDAYLIVGNGFGPINVFRTYNRFSFFGLRDKRRQVLSRENFVKAVTRAMSDSGALHLARLLLPLQRPLLVIPSPLPSLKGYDDVEKEALAPFRAAMIAGDEAALMDVYDSVIADLTSGGYRFLEQPAETLASRYATNAQFGDSAPRVSGEELRPENDYMHMNADYGAIVWKSVFRALA